MNDEPAKARRDAAIRRLLFAVLLGGFLVWVGSGFTETISFAPGSWRIWVLARLGCQAGGEVHRVDLRATFFDDEPVHWRRLRGQSGLEPLRGRFLLLRHLSAMLSFEPDRPRREGRALRLQR